MYTVSNEYKTQIRNMLRNPSYIKVNFAFIDPQAKVEAVLSDNGHSFLSDVENVKNAMISNTNYATLEYDRFVLDGKQTLLPESNYDYQGYISDVISGSDGIYANKPTLTINFGTTNFTFLGLGFTFDKYINEYPNQLQIKAYLDGNLVYDKTHSTNKADEYYLEDNIPLCNKIEVIGVQSTNKYRRFRIRDIVFGINKVFDSNVVTEAKWKRDVDLISSKLPNISFDFTILDIERQYDSENPEGLFVYLEEQQPCNFSLGYELDDGSIEWQQCGYLLSKGEVEVKGDAIIPNVKFNTVSTLNYLTKKYKKGLYTGVNKKLYDLVIELLEYSNLPKDSNGNDMWNIDSSLQSLHTLMPLPKLEVRELLQLIANASMCVLDVDRNGYITIKPQSNISNDFVIGLTDTMTVPSLKKYPTLQGVDTYSNSLVVDGSVSELGKFNISNANNTIYEFEYNMATEISAIADTGLTIVGTPQYYSESCIITLTGNGTLTINGKKLNISKRNISVEFNTIGERCPVENILITDESHAISYATWIGNYVNRRNEYTLTDRGFPEIDCGDNIKIETLFTNTTENVDVTVVASEINYNGSIKGTTKVLIQ